MRGVDELRVAWVAMGRRDDLLRVHGEWTAALPRVVGPAAGGLEWVSRTA